MSCYHLYQQFGTLYSWNNPIYDGLLDTYISGSSNTVVYMIFLSQEELQASHGAREKELNKQRAVDRVRVRDPANRQRIVSLLGYQGLKLDLVTLLKTMSVTYLLEVSMILGSIPIYKHGTYQEYIYSLNFFQMIYAQVFLVHEIN